MECALGKEAECLFVVRYFLEELGGFGFGDLGCRERFDEYEGAYWLAEEAY